MPFVKDDVISTLVDTLDTKAETRQAAEACLTLLVPAEGFVSFLMQLSVDSSVDPVMRLSAVIFAKNLIRRYWFLRSQQPADAVTVPDADKSAIKTHILSILEAALTQPDAGHTAAITKHVTEVLAALLGSFENDGNVFGKELLVHTESLVNSAKTSSDALLLSSLLCALYVARELTKHYRWSIQGFNIPPNLKMKAADQINDLAVLVNKLAAIMSPVLLELADALVAGIGQGNGSQEAYRLIYLVFKTFKYLIFNDIPAYLLTAEGQSFPYLDHWCRVSLAFYLLPSTDSTPGYRTRAQKWSIANVVRLYTKYGGGLPSIELNYLNINHEEHTEALRAYRTHFQTNMLPQCFESVFHQIAQWHEKKSILYDGTLYYSVRFFHTAVGEESVFSRFLSANINVLIVYLIFPLVVLSPEGLELFHEDDEEFFRKYYDVMNEDHRPDTAAVNFLYRLTNSHFKLVLSFLLSFLEDIFSRRAALQKGQDIQLAKETEAALRVVGILLYHISSPDLEVPVDAVIQRYVLPELAPSKELWVAARALETLAAFGYEFQDQEVLGAVFSGVTSLLDCTDAFLVQVEALDALRLLLINEVVKEHLKGMVTGIVSRLLRMILEYEVDFLSTILVEFILAFLAELQPFAAELLGQLLSQFLKLAAELADACALRIAYTEAHGSENVAGLVAMTALEDDKELQCVGILENLLVMAETMCADRLLLVRFVENFDPCVRYVVHNQVLVLLEETLAFETTLLRRLGRVTRLSQATVDYVLDNFESLGFSEYFDYFGGLFESYVLVHYAYRLSWAPEFDAAVPDQSQTPELDVQNVGAFTLDTDARMTALAQVAMLVGHQSIADGDYYAIFNLCITLVEDMVLATQNATLVGGVQGSELDAILALHGPNDDASRENELLSSLLEMVLLGFAHIIVGNLQSVVILTEEGADLLFAEVEMVQLVNNFVNVLFTCFMYKPAVVVKAVNNFSGIASLLDLVGRIDATNAAAVDLLPAEVPQELLFFQLVNKLFLTMNGNNPFLKMRKNTRFSVKLALLFLVKVLSNWGSLQNMGAGPEHAAWLATWRHKAYLRMILGVADVAQVDQTEQRAKKAQEAGHGHEELLDDDDFEAYLADEELSSMDNFKQNEDMRMRLVGYGGYGVGSEPSVKITDKVRDLMGDLEHTEPEVYGPMMEMVGVRGDDIEEGMRMAWI